MSIQTITDTHLEALLSLFDGATDSIKIMSPFITRATAELLCTQLERNPRLKCTVITRFVRQEFAQRASDLQSLKMLVQSGVRIYALRYLHAKLYLIDDMTGLMGSANFTSGGFRLNHELSLLLHDEPGIISELQAYYDGVLSEIAPQEEGPVTIEVIEREQAELSAVMSNWQSKQINYFFGNAKQRGAIISKVKSDTSTPAEDNIQTILSQYVKAAPSQQAWLKFEGLSEDREDPNALYSFNRLEHPPCDITCFPEAKKPTGIHSGDPIYMAVVTWDAKGRETPVIVGRCTTPGFEKENMATEQMIIDRPWMKRFPAYLVLQNLEFLTTAQKNGISLIELLGTIGTDLYPSTFGTGTPMSTLRTIHYQQSHLRITDVAARYIDSEFERLAKQYGTNLRPISNEQ